MMKKVSLSADGFINSAPRVVTETVQGQGFAQIGVQIKPDRISQRECCPVQTCFCVLPQANDDGLS